MQASCCMARDTFMHHEKLLRALRTLTGCATLSGEESGIGKRVLDGCASVPMTENPPLQLTAPVGSVGLRDD